MPTAILQNRPKVGQGHLGGFPYLAASLVHRHESLRRHTTLDLGGAADLYIEVGSVEDLKRILWFTAERELPVVILGGGSNVLFPDSGFRGIVLSLRRGFDWVTVDGDVIEAGSGAHLSRVVHEAYQTGLSGFEFAVGIPGSVGGALVMNAGTRAGAIGSIVENLHAVDRLGHERTIKQEEAGFRYRGSDLGEFTILSATFRLRPDRGESIAERMREIRDYRRKTQPPRGRSAGCVWKNGPDYSAGLLLDNLGFKGKRIGGAFVPDQHANFIINDGTATATDYLNLMAEMADAARREKGIELEAEVVCVGFASSEAPRESGHFFC
jgi:UDP-N-acetylmuramate dehydrogenase